MQAPAGAQEAVFLQVGVARLQVNLHLLASLIYICGALDKSTIHMWFSTSIRLSIAPAISLYLFIFIFSLSPVHVLSLLLLNLTF
jgi:hypothetical protein